MSHMSSLPVLTASDPSLFSRERQTAFLAALAATGNVRSASATARVSHQTAYRARLASPGFRRAWDAALVAARAQAEEVLSSRALEGWEEEVIYHGEVVATRRRYSDRLLLAHLARLDRLCGDAEVAQFADEFDAALARFAAGEDRPARAMEAGVPGVPASAGTSGGCSQWPEAPACAGARDVSSPEEWSMRSTRGIEPADAPPPLAPVKDERGDEVCEVQQLGIGLYQHWWDAELDCLLTNWPAPEGWRGEQFRIDPLFGQAAALQPHPDDPGLDADGADWPELEHWARTLTPDEEAGLAARQARLEAQHAGRLELYRLVHFGLGGAGLAAALEAANGGGWRAGAR
jgi:hypothetical protein